MKKSIIILLYIYIYIYIYTSSGKGSLLAFQRVLNDSCKPECWYIQRIVYQANIRANIPGYKEKVCLGVSKTTFKARYGNHKQSFTK